MLNHIVLMGRLTRDPELRYTQSQIPVASFRLAVDRDFGGRDGGERQTDFIDIVAWRSTAEFVSKYFTKGSMSAVCRSANGLTAKAESARPRRSWRTMSTSARASAATAAIRLARQRRAHRPRLTAAAMADMTMSPRAAAHFPSWTTMTAICRSDVPRHMKSL